MKYVGHVWYAYRIILSDNYRWSLLTATSPRVWVVS
jgi:hypothetical protein